MHIHQMNRNENHKCRYPLCPVCHDRPPQAVLAALVTEHLWCPLLRQRLLCVHHRSSKMDFSKFFANCVLAWDTENIRGGLVLLATVWCGEKAKWAQRWLNLVLGSPQKLHCSLVLSFSIHIYNTSSSAIRFSNLPAGAKMRTSL